MTDFVKCQKAETCTKADTYTHTQKTKLTHTQTHKNPTLVNDSF